MKKMNDLTTLLGTMRLENHSVKAKLQKLEESVAPGADPWQPPIGASPMISHKTDGAQPRGPYAGLSQSGNPDANVEASRATPPRPPGFSGGGVALELPPLKEPHYKDIERPERYDGNAEGWMEWNRTFRRFLRLRDAPATDTNNPRPTHKLHGL